MVNILIAISALAIFCLVKYLYRITKLEPAIIYLLMGILLGVILKKYGFENIAEAVPGIEKYNSVALLFMFFTAGFSINVAQLKRSGKTTAKLLSVPAYAEAVLSGGLIYMLLKLVPGMELSVAEALMVSSIFAVSSAANVVPVCVNMLQRGNKGEHNIAGTMIIVSIIDGFITVPLVFVSLMILIAENTGRTYGVLQILVLAILTMASILLALLMGLVLGRVELFAGRSVFKKLSRNDQGHMADMFLIFIAFAIAYIFGMILYSFDGMKEMISTFGILIMCGMGIAINNYDRTGAGEIIGRKGSIIFQMLGMPVIFIYVGAIIDMDTLTDPVTILLLLGITAAAVIIKGTASTVILKKQNYSAGEISFARKCFIPKGVSLINFSVLFTTILTDNENLVSFMAMLATAGIISTMTIGLPMLKKAGKEMK